MRDAHLIYSAAQAITVSARSTNNLAQAAASPARVNGPDMWINVAVSAAFLKCTSLQVALQDCATVDGSYEDVVLSPVITLASGGLAAGKVLLSVKVAKPLKKYRQIYYTLAGTAEDAATAKVNAWEDVQPLIAPA